MRSIVLLSTMASTDPSRRRSVSERFRHFFSSTMAARLLPQALNSGRNAFPQPASLMQVPLVVTATRLAVTLPAVGAASAGTRSGKTRRTISASAALLAAEIAIW